jgi:predicted Zn-dependent protease
VPTAQLFAQLSKEEGDTSDFATEFLQSHPLSAKRAQSFKASFDPKAHYRHALTRRDVDALMGICGSEPEVR